MKDLGDIQEDLGGISRYQTWSIVGAGLLSAASGFLTQSATFLSAVPNHRCAVPPVDVSFNLTEDDIKNYTIPYDVDAKEYESCYRKAYNLTYCDVINDITCIMDQTDVDGKMECDSGYRYETDVFTITPVSEWDLVCNRQYLDSLSTTLFFLGFFFGSFLIGPVTDWYGRKRAMQIMCFGMFLSTLLVSFMPNYTSYVIMRIVTATFTIACYIANFTYVSELSDSKWRTEAIMYINVNAGIIHTVYPWICYALREWRKVHFTISFAAVPCFMIFFFVPESPVWLLSKGRYDDAKVVVERYAQSNGTKLNEQMWTELVDGVDQKRQEEERTKEISKQNKVGVWDLFRRPLMRWMCVNSLVCWFTSSMVFYGLALNAGSLSGDFYLNNCFNSMVEIFGYSLVYFSGKLGRRPVLSVGFVGAGGFCIASMLVSLYGGSSTGVQTASTVLAIIGKLFATLAFALIYAVTSEVFPSNARATAISMGSMIARVGSMISPFALQLQTTIPWFTQTLFGSLSILSGALTLLYPETNGMQFIGTLDQAEEFYRNNLPVINCLNRRRNRKEENLFLEENGGGKANRSFQVEEDGIVTSEKL